MLKLRQPPTGRLFLALKSLPLSFRNFNTFYAYIMWESYQEIKEYLINSHMKKNYIYIYIYIYIFKYVHACMATTCVPTIAESVVHVLSLVPIYLDINTLVALVINRASHTQLLGDQQLNLLADRTYTFIDISQNNTIPFTQNDCHNVHTE